MPILFRQLFAEFFAPLFHNESKSTPPEQGTMQPRGLAAAFHLCSVSGCGTKCRKTLKKRS
jgi:hypothetical protein